jgi:uncharacterized DUF497 family protein
MEFEWDDPKAISNFNKHGVRFVSAVGAFYDPHRLDDADQRHEYNEERRVTIAMIDGRVFAVAYAPRGESIRLISARPASARERKRYAEERR